MGSLFPAEIWLQVLELLPQDALLNVRLSNKYLCNLTTPIIFSRIRLHRWPSTINIARKTESILSSSLVQYVRELDISSTILTADEQGKESMNKLAEFIHGSQAYIERLTIRVDYPFAHPLKKRLDARFLDHLRSIFSYSSLGNVKSLCFSFNYSYCQQHDILLGTENTDLLYLETSLLYFEDESNGGYFPNLQTITLSVDQSRAYAGHQDVIRLLTAGCNSIRALEVIYPGYNSDPLPCPTSVQHHLLTRFELDGYQMGRCYHLSDTLVPLLVPMTELVELELRDLLLYKNINDGIITCDNWVALFNVCCQMKNLLWYCLEGCGNTVLPWQVGAIRMPCIIDGKVQDGIRHTGFKTFWRIEYEALERLRGVVEGRRVKLGLSPEWEWKGRMTTRSQMLERGLLR